MAVSGKQQALFDAKSAIEGFIYTPEFITHEEESSLLAAIADMPLQEAAYKQYTARRRTVSYGSKFDYSLNRLNAAPEIPLFLFPLREKAAQWLELAPEELVHGLVSEYRPGTPLGWHRDVPEFEAIFGVSLGAACRMRLRPYRPGQPNRRADVVALELEPRSAYTIRGPARWGWQHSISATPELRYSITFRTARE